VKLTSEVKKVTTVLALMDRPAYEVMQDHTEFDRIARAICLERGDDDYLGAVEAYTAAWENARSVNGPGQTVAQVLSVAGIAPAEVEAGVRLLDRRDAGLKLQLDANVSAITPADVPVDAAGRVGLAPDADVGALLVNKEEMERRLARMKAADPRGRFGGPWDDGDHGRQRFKDADRAWVEARLDLVATAERAQALAAAKAKSEHLARQVDEEIREGIAHQAGVKALDQHLAALHGDLVTTRAQRAAVGVAGEPGPGRVFLLESQAAATASGDFARERAYLLDELGLDADTVKALESYALANRAPTALDAAPVQPRHPATGRFQRADDDGLAAQLAAGGRIDVMGKVTPADPAGRSGLDVPGAGRPLAPHSSITRAGFDAQVRAQMARNGKPWATAAREVAGVLAPQMNSDDLAACGVLAGPAV
jgi:hypothetical protein